VTFSRGDRSAQRSRRKDRYRGCCVCGEPNAKRCADCRAVEPILAREWPLSLSLFVDGSFVRAGIDPRDLSHAHLPRPRRPRYAALRAQVQAEHPSWGEKRVDAVMFSALGGDPRAAGPGYGGAGLVLATATGEVLATRSCAFPADHSADAELHAVIRGARWAPGAVIYTDSESTCWTAIASNKNLDVRFVLEKDRGPAYELAHQLSVEGRLRQLRRSMEAPLEPETDLVIDPDQERKET
jgi:hypothetical protein